MSSIYRFEDLPLWWQSGSLFNDYIDRIEGLGLIDEYEKISREIAGFITGLNKSTIKSQKF